MSPADHRAEPAASTGLAPPTVDAASLVGRRRFVQQAGVATVVIGLPTIVPTAALGRADTVAPSNKITVGCIGVGGMGTANMRVFLGLDDCRVLAVCDTYEDRRQKAKASVDAMYDTKDCAVYGDYRELLARQDIDAVMIAAQDHWHALIATAAARAGKDLYCEKPLGVSVEQGQKMRAAVRKHQRVFQSGTWQRSQPKFRYACELARNGYVGKVHTVQVSAPGPKYQPSYTGALDPQTPPAGFDWTMWRGPASPQPYNPGRVAWPDWYLIWDYCAGFVCNWGIHHLDIAHWGCPQLGSETFTVECQAGYRKKGWTDNIEEWNASFTFAGGLKMVFTDDTRQKTGVRFIGDQGWVHVDRAGIWAEPASLLKVKLKDDELHLYASKHHQDDFLGCVRSRKDPVSNVDATHVASYLGLIADIAARCGRKLVWDPQAERFGNDDDANRHLVRPLHNGWLLT